MLVKMGRDDSTHRSQSNRPQSLPVVEVETYVHACLLLPDKGILSWGKEGF